MLDCIDSNGHRWKVGETVLKDGSPKLGKILDILSANMVLVKFGSEKAVWMETSELLHYTKG